MRGFLFLISSSSPPGTKTLNRRALFHSLALCFALCLALCLAASLHAWGRKEVKSVEAQPAQNVPQTREAQTEPEEKRVVRVSGRVRLVGHDPFPELVISGEDGEWYIAKEEEYKLKDLQQRTVEIEGEETVIELIFASGISAGQRRTLTNIRIISVK